MDVQAAWRNFLADTFGKDVGEVLARGAPRALGVDLSGRVGEQNIIPFSRFLADRRRLEDAMQSAALDSLGSPFGMVSNVLLGTRDMLNGNIVEGMQKLVPTAIRGPIAAYRMTQNGYEDGKGNRLPMSAGANDVMVQALGFAPAERAEYSEANLIQKGRQGSLQREAANIRQNIAKALERGDQADAQEWLTRARQFDQNHPTQQILPRLAATMQARATARAQAEAYGVPIGTRVQDQQARGLTAFANF